MGTINFTTPPSDPATGAKQDAQTAAIGLTARETGGHLAAVDTNTSGAAGTLVSILAKIVPSAALDATVVAGNAILTTLRAALPTSLVGNRLDVNIGAATTLTTQGTTTATLGTTDAAHLANTDTATTAGAASLVSILAKQPTTPALEHTTAASPSAVRASDGSAFISQALEGGNLATVATNTGRIPAQGQALAASSTPVVLPSIQVAAMATSAAQTTAQTSFTSIDGKLPAALAANGGLKIEGVAGGVAVPTSSALGSTAANQTSILTALALLASQTTQALIKTAIDTLVTNSAALVGGRVPIVSGGLTSTTITSIPVTGLLVHTGPATFNFAQVFNGTSAGVIMMVFDLASATLVSTTTKPIYQINVAGASALANVNPPVEISCVNGIVIAASQSVGPFVTCTNTNPTVLYGHVTWK